MRRAITWLSAGLIASSASAASAQNATPRNLILFIPDGLRGKIVNAQTVIKFQRVLSTRYSDVAGFPGRTLGLDAPAAKQKTAAK